MQLDRISYYKLSYRENLGNAKEAQAGIIKQGENTSRIIHVN